MKVKSTDYPLTDSIKTKIADFETGLKKYYDHTDEVVITLSKESPSEFRVDFQIYAFGKTIRSHYLSHDFHKAFKLSSDHFIDSIIKAKKKIQEH